ncbi:hypothetical protein [Nocardioides cavernaquae]|uniref:Uncharacterized protein n=1 Tax=Nocardioides cavernaquae TaxID=2321396 RepID=A0A3A5H240_9ACTN|nr:hypothetical protein [Nocardioides cavernaquae]RJS44886.1 hypothetical protein D4739_00585 [Nocardioides cavernaquae]
MNDTAKLEVRPGVAEFVEQVRARLADLTAEERTELTDGLGADLHELVAERGPEALGDPTAYAAELRAAAGFSPTMGKVRDKRELSAAIHAALDSARGKWDALVEGLPGDPWGLIQAVRPAWWILRAWLALQLVDLVWGNGGLNLGLSVVPSLLGWGAPLLAVASIVSVQIGRGKLWPGKARGNAAVRLLLLALNAVAIAVIPVTFTSVFTPAKASIWYPELTDGGSAHLEGGIQVDGRNVTNLFPYDASGKPLKGVQLFDQDGQPVSIDESRMWDEGEELFIGYPWLSNGEARFNVFPVPEGHVGAMEERDASAWTSDNPPAIPAYPLESAPEVGLPTDPEPAAAPEPATAPKQKAGR